MSQTVVPINPVPITAWQISTATAGDVVEALNSAAQLGWQANVTCLVQPNSNGTLVWTVALSCDGKRLTAYDGNWIVSDGTHVDVLTNEEFAATYTAAPDGP